MHFINQVLVILVLLVSVSPWVNAAKVIVYGHEQVDLGSESSAGDKIVLHGKSRIEDKKRGRFNITPAEKLGCGMTAIANFEYPHLVKPKTPVYDSAEFANNARAVAISTYKLMAYEASSCG